MQSVSGPPEARTYAREHKPIRRRDVIRSKSSRPPANVELVRILRAIHSETPGRQGRAPTRALPKIGSTRLDAKARYVLRRIHRILRSLSAAERLALVLRYMATLKIDEVADLLAVPARTVRRWVNQAPVPRGEPSNRTSASSAGIRSGRRRRRRDPRD